MERLTPEMEATQHAISQGRILRGKGRARRVVKTRGRVMASLRLIQPLQQLRWASLN